MTFEEFDFACREDGLCAKKCTNVHWQIIKNGKPVVNYWPTANKVMRINDPMILKSFAGDAVIAIENALDMQVQQASSLDDL